MANRNAIPPFHDVKLDDIHEAIGVTQIGVEGDANAWHQTIGGLIFQGGYFEIGVDTTLDIPFIVAPPTLVLWVGLTRTNSTPGAAAAEPRWTGVGADNATFQVDYGREPGDNGTATIKWFAVGV